MPGVVRQAKQKMMHPGRITEKKQEIQEWKMLLKCA